MTHRLKGTLGKYDPYSRSVPIIASTTNSVDGERITKWDLSRFVKNPTILWNHEADCIPVALASDISFEPTDGLLMNAHFGSSKANPLAEQLAACVEEGLVRATSVGYDMDGDTAVLHEVSFVSIGADEDAGTAHIHPDHPENEAAMRLRVSNAARELGLHRARARSRLVQKGATNMDAFLEFELSMQEARNLDAKLAPGVKEGRLAKAEADKARYSEAKSSAEAAQSKADASGKAEDYAAAAQAHVAAASAVPLGYLSTTAKAVGEHMEKSRNAEAVAAVKTIDAMPKEAQAVAHEARAVQLTAKADSNKFATANEHKLAADAHSQAARAHEANGNKEQAAHHKEMAGSHGKTESAIKTVTARGGNETSKYLAQKEINGSKESRDKIVSARAESQASAVSAPASGNNESYKAAADQASALSNKGMLSDEKHKEAADMHKAAAAAAPNPAAKAAHEAAAEAHIRASDPRASSSAAARAHDEATAASKEAVSAGSSGGGQAPASGGGGGGGADGRSRDELGRFDANEVRRMDASGRLQKATRTSIGGARIPARLGRLGVLTYVNPDGTKRRELRLESEVFKADSLATLRDVPVIDISDHTKIHGPDTWKKIARGHVSGEPKREGQFIVGELAIQDADTLNQIDNSERTEISLGYNCRLDWTSGIYEGEEYDCIQRNIRYNHAALCPPNRGRAGPEVGLRLDNNQDEAWGESHLDIGDQVMKVIVIDGREYVVGSAEHIAKLEDLAKANAAQIRLDSKTALDEAAAKSEKDLKDLQVRLDKAEAERDDLKSQLDKVNLDAKKSAEEDEKKKEEEAKLSGARKRFRRALERLYANFKKAFGEEEKEDDEEKMDAMSDRELMLACIKLDQPNFDSKDRSDDYVQARFDSIAERVKKQGNPNGVDSILRAGQRGNETLNLDANDQTGGSVGGIDIEKARRERDVRMLQAGRTVQPTGTGK